MGTQPSPLAPTWQWLEDINHPGANMILRRAGHALAWPRGGEADRRRFLDMPSVSGALDRQNSDGSWGGAAPSEDRVLPTLWVLKALVDGGLDRDTEQVSHAIEFLGNVGRARLGYFSTSRDDAGVSGCLIGLAERLYRDAGAHDLADRQLEWLRRFQQIVVDGEPQREIDEWEFARAPRCALCGQDNPCTLSVVRAAGAWARSEFEEDAALAVLAREEVLRRLADPDYIAALGLPTPGPKPDTWISMGFPMDWHLDLLGVLDEVSVGVSAADERATGAVNLLMTLRRSEGSFSRGWHVTSGYLRGFAVPEKGLGNAMATARAAVVLERWLG